MYVCMHVCQVMPCRAPCLPLHHQNLEHAHMYVYMYIAYWLSSTARAGQCMYIHTYLHTYTEIHTYINAPWLFFAASLRQVPGAWGEAVSRKHLRNDQCLNCSGSPVCVCVCVSACNMHGITARRKYSVNLKLTRYSPIMYECCTISILIIVYECFTTRVYSS